MKKEVNLIKNCIETPDGTLLYSRHRHDYQSHLDENGKTYFTDGGLEYVRCSSHGDEIHHCVWDDDNFDKVREALEWGSYGKGGDQPMSWIRLCDMETDHIEAVLENADTMVKGYARIMRLELEYREIKEEYDPN